VCKLFLTGHAARTLEALQRFGLTRALFPVLPSRGGRGKAAVTPLLAAALRNTDQRVAEQLSVTPAFLYAALLWQPVTERADALCAEGEPDFQAVQRAADEVIAEQIQRTALPRRFSTVTREIWTMQRRLSRTRGKRAMRVLHHPKFRAAYDFLLLRAQEDESLQALVEFWTRAQRAEEGGQVTSHPQRRRPRRRARRKPRQRPSGEGR
jgi:poly(A) polymerase